MDCLFVVIYSNYVVVFFCGQGIEGIDHKNLLFVRLYAYPQACFSKAGSNGIGPWCKLDENWLTEMGHGKLRHFVADGNTLLALLEEPLANSQEPQPTIVGKFFQ